jgi:adenine-specific DNA-methyltransferase
MTEIEKLDLRSADIAVEKRRELLALFPEVRTEDDKIDFDRLRQALGETVDVGKERYGLNWPGKADCFKTIQAPSLGTLLPCREESVNFDTTENLIIEGDNLEVLKLLQKSYLGKVKMIFIDPPYNTGNDFIYPDDYAESLQTYLEYTGQVDAHGRKFGTNTEADGRFHSKWLNMMYPRLYVARNLLRADGCVFITIDDKEVSNLKALLNEIFGEENFVANVVWQKKYAVSNDDPGIAAMHDHILVYQKSDSFARNLLPRTEKQTQRYSNPDKDPRGPWSSDNYVSNKSRFERPTLWYPIRHPRTHEDVWPDESAVWRYAKDTHAQVEAEDRLYWGPNQSYQKPRLKRFLSEIQAGIVPSTWWEFEEVGHNDEAQKETGDLIGKKVFTTPKPVRLMKRILALGSNPESLVMDFFAGSGALGHAVAEMNAEDDGHRRFLLIQLPEETGLDDFKTVADITKARIRRAFELIAKEQGRKLPLASKPDLGFRVFKLDESNFATWHAETPHDATALIQQLELHVDHMREEREPEDILYEILLKSGYPLTTTVESRQIEGKTVFSVAEGLLLVCLESELTLEVVRAMVNTQPERVVCLDEGFAGNDQLKTNAAQIFKNKGIVFRTI